MTNVSQLIAEQYSSKHPNKFTMITIATLLSILPVCILNEKETKFYIQLKACKSGWTVCYAYKSFKDIVRKGYPVCTATTPYKALAKMLVFIHENHPQQLNWD